MKLPLVSVIVPIYKVEQYLPRCLDSLVAQDYRPLEVILVNDGSPDRCDEIMRDYASRYDIFKMVFQENAGLSGARNKGISLATGEYIALVDSDDYVVPDFISMLVNMAREQHADVAVCNFYLKFPSGKQITFPLMTGKKRLTGHKAAKNCLRLISFPVFAWNKLYRRELFTDYDVSFPHIHYEDVATISRVLLNARHVAITRKPGYYYCLRSTGITGNFGLKNIVDYLKAIDIMRHFIRDEGLWESWNSQYRSFLRRIEAQLFIEITLQKNNIPRKDRSKLIRQVRNRMRILSQIPETAAVDLSISPLGEKHA